MRIIYSFAGSIITGVLIQMLLLYADGKYGMKEEKKGGLIVDRFSLLIMLIGMVFSFFFVFWNYENIAVPEMIADIAIVVGVGVLSVTDYRIRTVPNRFIIGLLVVWATVVAIWFVVEVISPENVRTVLLPAGGVHSGALGYLISSVFGAVLSGGIFFICYLLTRRKLGAGDVKLAFTMGLFMTSRRIMGAILYGCALCLVTALVLVAMKKLKMKDSVPMVPFLYIGMLAAYLII